MPQTSVPEESKVEKYRKRLKQLEAEREPFEEIWREIAEFMVPERGRLLPSDRENQGRKKHQSIVNGTATNDGITCAAGIASGVHNQAHEWFSFTTGDDDLDEVGPVKAWLSDVSRLVRLTLSGSNLYKVLPRTDVDLVFFNSACLYFEQDTKDLVRFIDVPVGQYYWAVGAEGRVDTVYRVFDMTARQMEQEFGKAALSQAAREALSNGQGEKYFCVVHVVEPNSAYQKNKRGPANKKYSSCWFERAQTEGEKDKTLRERGYGVFPYACPRWETTGNTPYGTSGPGRRALGDTKSIQTLERRKAQLVERMVAPPVQAAGLAGQKVNLGPGEVVHVDAITAGKGIAPILEVRGEQLVAAEQSIREGEARVGECFFRTLWRMLETSEGQKMTATEVAERKNEKMQQLAPVLAGLNDELSAPIVEFVYYVLLINGALPPPPEELQGREFDIEFLNILAKAQKAMGVASTDRFIATIGAVAAIKADIVDKVNTDQLADRLAAALGVDPSIINTDEEVAKIRQGRAQAQAAAQQQEDAANQVQAAKVLSETDTSSDNALTRILGALGVQR